MARHLKWVGVVLMVSSVARSDGGIVAEVTVRNDKGTVYCSLYQSKEGFPNDVEKSVARTSDKPEDGEAECVFPDVKPGEYAISSFHEEDENGTGQIRRNFFGIPKDEVGTSNDAKGHFGPPKFEDAKFKYEGKPLTLQIHLKQP